MLDYTKGEWEVRTYVASVFGNQAALTCKEVWAGERRIASTINEANAQLIAKSPLMYEALMEFPHYITASDMDTNQILDAIREWRHKYWQPAVEK